MRADAAQPFSQTLRERTEPAHRALESRLDLLRPPLDRRRFRGALQAFEGFYRGWEPALAAGGLPEAADYCSRLPLLRADLEALGAPEPERAAAGAAALADTPERALGALYVVEGSSLGGRIIGRAVAEAPWAPAGGLAYFDPHGAETGARWRAFKARLDAVEAGRQAEVVAGATATFAFLEARMAEALAGLEELTP